LHNKIGFVLLMANVQQESAVKMRVVTDN